MSKRLITLTLLVPLNLWGQSVHLHPLSLEEALDIACEQNLSLMVAREDIATAKAESQELNALWYPSIGVSGEYTHSRSEIAAVTTVGEIGSELLGNLAPIVSGNPVIEGLVESVSKSQIRLPLVPRNTAEVGAELVWVVFSGGRRVAATRISNKLLSLANEQYNATQNGVITAVAEAYWGLSLAQQLTNVRRSATALYNEHLRQARRLEEEGMINRAERLVAEVAYEQSTTLLVSAESNQRVAAKALSTLLGTDTLCINPTTPLSMPVEIPSREALMTALHTTPTINSLKYGEEIATLLVNAERSRYLPTVALLGHQQLWSSGLDKNIFPRTFVSVGLSWTLFDGLSREGAVARSKSALRTAQTTHKKSLHELQTAIDKYYATLTTAMAAYHAEQTTLALAEELLRTQRKAFAEGMATSSDVVDAAQRLSEVKLSHLATLYSINTSLATLLMLAGRSDSLTTYFTPCQL